MQSGDAFFVPDQAVANHERVKMAVTWDRCRKAVCGQPPHKRITIRVDGQDTLAKREVERGQITDRLPQIATSRDWCCSLRVSRIGSPLRPRWHAAAGHHDDPDRGSLLPWVCHDLDPVRCLCGYRTSRIGVFAATWPRHWIGLGFAVFDVRPKSAHRRTANPPGHGRRHQIHHRHLRFLQADSSTCD
jgi:hypothetical protein